MLLVCACLFVSFAQTAEKTSLIVANCEESEKVCDTQQVFRYDFVEGGFVGKEKILTVKTSDIRFDLGNNRIYRNRYLINNWGDVVDVAGKKIRHKSDGELVEIVGDDVVIKVNRTDERGIFIYNLRNGSYGKLKSPNIYEADGAVSPDKKSVASHRYGKGIILKNFVGGKQKVIKGQFAVRLSERANETGELPLFWIDNERILTQKSNGEIIIVHANGGIEPVADVEIKDALYVSPTFYRNKNGEIIYSCSDVYVVDVVRKKISEYVSFPLGSDFLARADETVKSNGGSGTIYFYKDKEIGRFWATGATAADNFLAIAYGKEGSNLGYPDGVKVWNSFKKDWMTLEIKRSPQIIGWITH